MHPWIIVHPIPALKDNYIWVVINETEKKAIVVDPGAAQPVTDYLTAHHLVLKAIFVTHHHWDHTDGVISLRDHYQVPVYGSVLNQSGMITHPVQDGEEVHVKDFPDFKVLSIPGHTLDHIAYYAKGILFCGDTLFAAGCGRVFEGSFEQMYASLQKMAHLPNDTKVYCAHEYTANNLRFAAVVEPHNTVITEKANKVAALREKHAPSLPSSILEEKATNPFLRCDVPEVITHASQHAAVMLHNDVDVFTALRKWKDGF